MACKCFQLRFPTIKNAQQKQANMPLTTQQRCQRPRAFCLFSGQRQPISDVSLNFSNASDTWQVKVVVICSRQWGVISVINRSSRYFRTDNSKLCVCELQHGYKNHTNPGWELSPFETQWQLNIKSYQLNHNIIYSFKWTKTIFDLLLTSRSWKKFWVIINY